MIPFNKFTVTSACRLSLTVSGLPDQRINVYKDAVSYTDNPVARRLLVDSGLLQTTLSNQMIINIPEPGTYYIAVRPSNTDADIDATMTVSGLPVPFTITLSTFCDSYCVNPSFPTTTPSCQTTCGNGILE